MNLRENRPEVEAASARLADYYTLDEGEPACTTGHGEGSGELKHHRIG
jgi:hypothetical protein